MCIRDRLGNVQQVREELVHLEQEFERRDAAIKEISASGGAVSEQDYQQLYELDVRRKQLKGRLEELEVAQSDSAEALDKVAEGGKRLLRQEVTEDEIASVVSASAGIPVSRMMETERAKLLVME